MRPTNRVSLRKARWGAGMPASSRTARVRCQTLPNSTCASVTCGQPRFVWLGRVLLGRCRGTIVRGPSTPLSTDCVRRAGILHERATLTTHHGRQQTGGPGWDALDETGPNAGAPPAAAGGAWALMTSVRAGGASAGRNAPRFDPVLPAPVPWTEPVLRPFSHARAFRRGFPIAAGRRRSRTLIQPHQPGHRRPCSNGDPREQAHLPAEQPSPGQDPRLPSAHAHPRRSRHPGGPPSQGPHRAVRLRIGRVLPARHRLRSSAGLRGRAAGRRAVPADRDRAAALIVVHANADRRACGSTAAGRFCCLQGRRQRGGPQPDQARCCATRWPPG